MDDRITLMILGLLVSLAGLFWNIFNRLAALAKWRGTTENQVKNNTHDLDELKSTVKESVQSLKAEIEKDFNRLEKRFQEDRKENKDARTRIYSELRSIRSDISDVLNMIARIHPEVKRGAK